MYFIAYDEILEPMKIYFLYELESIDSPIHTLSVFMFEVLSSLRVKGAALPALLGGVAYNLGLILEIAKIL